MSCFRVKLIHCGNKNIAVAEDNSQKNMFYIPMGLFAIGSELKNENFDVELIHMDIEYGQPVQDIVNMKDIDAIGFDCHWINQAYTVIKTIELIKNINANIYVFIGGFSASYFAKEIVSNFDFVDAVIRGDGEKPVVELCRTLNYLKQNKEGDRDIHMKNIPNLVWINNDGQIEANDFTYVAGQKDLDNLDYAQLDILRNWKDYREFSRYFTRFEHISKLPKFLLSIGRGCKYTCSFCGGNAKAQKIINNRTCHIHRSVDSVINTMKKANSFGYTLFYSCFDFIESDKWYIDLFNRIKDEPDLKVSFIYGCYSIPSKSLIEAMSEAFEYGVVELSPETSNETLRKENKDTRIYYSNSDLEECLTIIDKTDNLKSQLFFGYFLPGDTKNTVTDTMKYISHLYSKFEKSTEIIYGNFSTDPASLLYLDPTKYEMKLKIQSFRDYLNALEENYIFNKKESKPDMTKFRPLSMELSDFNALSNQIRLFTFILSYFSKSLSYIMDKIDNVTIVVDYLNKMSNSEIMNFEFTTEHLKHLVIDLVQNYTFLNQELINSILQDALKSKGIDFRLKANI